MRLALPFVFSLILLLANASLIDDDNFDFPLNVTSSRTVHANVDLQTLSRQRVSRCGRFCRFRLCNFNGETKLLDKASFTILNGPRSASLPYVCLPGTNIGKVVSSLEARVRDRGNFIPISRFSPRGLNARYRRNFIRTAPVPFLPWSGIARGDTSGHQWSFLHDKCMIMPITRYEEIDPSTELVKKVVRAGTGNTNCVAFRTTAPAIQVELIWDSGDDFDIEVREPDGDLISFERPKSETGKLNGDNNVGFCDTNLKLGKENVVYFPGGPIEDGEYKVKITHFTKCGTSPTVFRLRVIVNGEVQLTRRGTANRGEKEVVLRAAFSYP